MKVMYTLSQTLQNWNQDQSSIFYLYNVYQLLIHLFYPGMTQVHYAVLKHDYAALWASGAPSYKHSGQQLQCFYWLKFFLHISLKAQKMYFLNQLTLNNEVLCDHIFPSAKIWIVLMMSHTAMHQYVVKC